MSAVSDEGKFSWLFSMKTVSLVLLILQTTTLVTSIRYSLTVPGPRYYPTTAVFWMEVIKLFTALLVIFWEKGGRPRDFLHVIRHDVFVSGGELIRLSVPSFIYTLQNNVLYVAIANLDAPTYQVTYNAKILTTGLFAVAMLGKKLSAIQWAALVALVVGVSSAQYVPSSSSEVIREAASAAGGVTQSRMLGLGAVGVACVTSGFAGVYFEKVLKSGQSSLWVRNVQMSVASVPLSLLSVYLYDAENVQRDGFNFGYTPMVWSIVVNQAVGGLLVAVVVKYADNLLKAFAAAISVVLSCLIASMFFDFVITPFFVFGSTVVMVSTYVYSVPESVNRFVPSFMKEPSKALPV